MNASKEGSSRIWLLPDVYWKITKGMPQAEINALMCKVERLAEAQDLDALRHYPFIYIGENCHRRSAQPAVTSIAGSIVTTAT